MSVHSFIPSGNNRKDEIPLVANWIKVDRDEIDPTLFNKASRNAV